ncbi:MULTISPECIES: ABC transporter ATP-binding protein/permease [Coprobacillaceae]|uniref:ABC transporter ATP-binding protein/permease n=1 Tax=Coprobacillaceae TaxID=2810280 RepID=UPI000E4B7ED8|nr:MULTISPECIES: ABC transporter ATP-binding protein/permease [Coprobacillaceae]RHM61892.1 ABC transporter ATP-binding protein/permease [Coprobacillus sp. AF33-1AC]RHS94681.1 ABC transporter ATP-binding protein/permease [Erysipelatoclostridium sp. AM42-17]
MFNKRLLKYFSKELKYVYLIVLAQWLILLVHTALSYYHVEVLQKLYHHQNIEIISYMLIVLGLIVLRLFLQRVQDDTAFKVSTLTKSKLREDVFKKVYQLSSPCFNQATLTQLLSEGIEQLDIYCSKYLPQFYYALLAPLTLFIFIVPISFKVAITLLICVPLIPLSIIVVQKIAKKLLAKYWNSYTGLASSFLENLQGLTTLKLYQSDKIYQDKMDLDAEDFRKKTMKVLIMQLNSISIMDIVAYGGFGIGVILSVIDYQNHILSLGQTLLMIMVSIEFFLPLRLLGSYFHIASNGNEAANKIFKLLDQEEKETGSQMMTSFESIQFDHVDFAYEDIAVIKDLSFSIKKGDFVAIVGKSGSGKSTLTSLMFNDYQIQKGKILYNQIPIHQYSKKTLYQHLTLLQDDTYIFKGTLQEHLALSGNDCTKDYLKVLKLVKLDQLGGLDFMVEEGGRNLSGGQKQRLALARVLLHDSDLYIFDEATSNIDSESEKIIMNAICELAKTKTVMMITHRMYFSQKARHIIVLKDGHIQEQGTYQQLMQKEGYYKELYQSQENLERILHHE